MRLVRDHSAGARAVSVPRLACGRMVRLSETVIDLDGPAFAAYYHDACAPVSGPVVIAPNRDCLARDCRLPHDLARRDADREVGGLSLDVTSRGHSR